MDGSCWLPSNGGKLNKEGLSTIKQVSILGVDLAKNVFQLHGVDHKGRTMLTRRVHREQLLRIIGELPPCLIGIEASTGAFYWQRQFEKLGHTVKIIAPQYVKPFVRRQKNDSNDAEAICTAIQQPNMRFVPKKTLEQQDIQALHRARQRLVNHRTALISQMRGLLLDRGIAIAVSARRARLLIPKILATFTDELTELMREIITSLYAFLLQIDERIRELDRKITEIFKASAVCQRIAKIRGVGPKTATAMIAAIGEGADFKNGRHLAAWLGLVPRQHSSGERRILMGITKRGSQHLRTLLVHGARAVVRTAVRKTDTLSTWVNELRLRRGYNRATVAVANKNARVIWAVLTSGEPYRVAA
jgi:transposase